MTKAGLCWSRQPVSSAKGSGGPTYGDENPTKTL